MSYKEAETRKENKYVFIEFVILTFLSTVSGSLYFFLWIIVTVLFYFLTLCSFVPTQLFLHLIKYISFLYFVSLKIQLYLYCFIQLLLKTIKRTIEKNM